MVPSSPTEGAHQPATSASTPTDLTPPTIHVTRLDLGGDVVFVTDREGTIVDVNEAFVRVTGYARSEAIGATPRLLKSGQQDDAFYSQLWRTITEGHVWRGQLVDRRRDGSLRTYHSTITPIQDEAGRITHFVAVERDLTDELFRTSASGTSGLVHTDHTGRCVFADARASSILGRPTAELLGVGLFRALRREDAEELADVIGMAADTGREHRLEVRTATGRWLHLEVSPLTMASGETVGSAIAVDDVGQQVAAQQELERREAMLDSVLDALPDPIAVVDPDGTVVATNGAWRAAASLDGAHPVLQAGLGDNLRRTVRAAGASAPEVGDVLADLHQVLSGVANRRRRPSGVDITQLRWEEGGAVLRLDHRVIQELAAAR